MRTTRKMLTVLRAAAGGAVPVNTVAPSYSGTVEIGTSLTGVAGTWVGDETIVVVHQWQRSDNGVTDWGDISGATSLNYTPVSADGDKYIRRQETATNDAGSATAFTSAAFVSIVLFTVTTTAPNQTLTITTFGVSASTTIEWGDAQSNAYTGTAQRTHQYASAGTYTVRILQPLRVTTFDLRDTKVTVTGEYLSRLTQLTNIALLNIPLTWTVSPAAPFPQVTGYVYLVNLPLLSWTVSETNPFPQVTSYVYLASLPLLSWTVSEALPFPQVTSSVTLINLPLLSWTVSETNPFPQVTSSVTLQTLPLLSWTVSEALPFPRVTSYVTLTGLPLLSWTTGAAKNLHSVGAIIYESNLSQAAVDAVLADLYSYFDERTKVGTIDLLGGNNAAPSGTLQAACPPATGKEYAYELVNDSCGVSAFHWTSVTTAA